MEVDAEWDSVEEFGTTISQRGGKEETKRRNARIKRGSDGKPTWEAVELMVRAEKKDAMPEGSDRLEERKRMELGRTQDEKIAVGPSDSGLIWRRLGSEPTGRDSSGLKQQGFGV